MGLSDLLWHLLFLYSHFSFYFRKCISCLASGSMACVSVLLSCGNDDKTLKLDRESTFDEFRAQVKSLFPHLPEVSRRYLDLKHLHRHQCEKDRKVKRALPLV